MKCPKCNAEIPDGSTVCPKCDTAYLAPPAAPPKPRTSLIAVICFLLAMTSFIALSIVCTETPFVTPHLITIPWTGIIVGVVAIILGSLALSQISNSSGRIIGKSWSIIGLLIAVISLVFNVIIVATAIPA